jgi:hypothetical protein
MPLLEAGNFQPPHPVLPRGQMGLSFSGQLMCWCDEAALKISGVWSMKNFQIVGHWCRSPVQASVLQKTTKMDVLDCLIFPFKSHCLLTVPPGGQ